MHKITKKIWNLEPPGGVFDETVIMNLTEDMSAGARRAWVHRTLKSGEICQIRRGLYSLNPDYFKTPSAHPFLVSEMIYWPSYISFETGLRFFGLIPEFVSVITSATSKRAKIFNTPYGQFSYQHLPSNSLYTDVNWVKVGQDQHAQVASPLRCIADLIYTRKEISWKKDGANFLIDSLRIEAEDLRGINFSQSKAIISASRSRRVKEYILNLTKEVSPWDLRE